MEEVGTTVQTVLSRLTAKVGKVVAWLVMLTVEGERREVGWVMDSKLERVEDNEVAKVEDCELERVVNNQLGKLEDCVIERVVNSQLAKVEDCLHIL